MANNDNLYIRLFGSLSISTPESGPLEIPPSRAGGLIAVLAIAFAAGNPVHREEIVDLLWPEDDADNARHKLRQTLYDVRRQLAGLNLRPEDVLMAKRSSLQLNPEKVTVDAAMFEAELNAAARTDGSNLRMDHLERAVQLYRGDLLPGFYQDKFISEKTRLEEAYHRALKALARCYEETEQFDRCIETDRKLLALNPLNEEAHLALMRIYAATGQPSAVVRQFQSLERVLNEELGETPSKSAQQAMETLRETANSNAASVSVALPTRASASPILDTPTLSREATPEVAPRVECSPMPVTAQHSRRLSKRNPITAAVAVLAAAIVVSGIAVNAIWKRQHKFANIPPKSPSATRPPVKHSEVLARYVNTADERGSEPTAMATDPTGNLYVAGFVETTHTDADFITLKYDRFGHLLWRRRYDGTGHDVDRLRCISVDSRGNVYVSGESDNGKGNGSTRLSGLDVVTIKYDASGKELGQDRYDDIDKGDDRPVKMLLDSTGNAYVLCNCRRLRNGKDAGSDFVLIKYSSNLKRLWVRRFDGEYHGDDVPTSMALMYKNSGVCVCGYSQALYKSGPEYDYVTIKYSANGDQLWVSRYGANNQADDKARDISADEDGNVYVVGEGRGLPGTMDEAKNGCIMVKYSPTGYMLSARGTVKESDRLQSVTATAFWTDGSAAVAGPIVNENSNSFYRVVLRDSDGGVKRLFDIPAIFHPLYRAPVALVIWPEDMTHDAVWMVGSRAKGSKASLEFIVAALSSSEGLCWRDGFSAANEFNAAKAAVLCLQGGPTKIVVAGLCTDDSGKGGIVLVKYSE